MTEIEVVKEKGEGAWEEVTERVLLVDIETELVPLRDTEKVK